MPDNVVFPYPEGFFDDDLPGGVLSPSGISRYLNCPRQYEYAYVHKKKKPPGIAAAKGKALHFGAEQTHLHTIEYGKPLEKDAALAIVADKFDAELEDVDPRDLKNPEMPVGVVKDAAVFNFDVYYRFAVPKITPIAVEAPFARRIGDVPVRGIIDLLDEVDGDYTLETDPDGPPPRIIEVADLKTSKKRWTEQQIQFDMQLTIYSIIEDVETVRVDLLLDQKKGCSYSQLRAPRSPMEKRVIVEDIQTVAQAIKMGIFPRCKPTEWVCSAKWCGYYEECRGKR